MITTPHIITPKSIIAFVGGKNYTIPAGSLRHKEVIAALRKQEEKLFVEAVTKEEIEVLSHAAGQKFVVKNGVVFLDGIEIIGALQQKLARLIAEELPIDYFVQFVRNLRQNTSNTAVKELYDFLGYKELAITADGCFLAYKGVNDNYWSCTAGKTKLKQGKVDGSGRIFNGIGEVIECDRVEVDDDRRNQCSNGLHVGSEKYATGFGQRTVVVKVNPAHVVSVPLDHDCQKMRVCKYEIIGDYSKEILSATTDKAGREIKSPLSEKAARIQKSVDSLRKRGGEITLSRLQSAISPDSIPLHELRDICSRILGLTVAINKNKPTSVGYMFIA
jgi:hypothetical protein